MIKSKFIYFCFAFITLLEAKVPQWYLNPPIDNKEFYFSTGTGISIKEATDEALNQIASQINVTINSSFEKETISNEGNSGNSYDKSTRQKVASIVKGIDFNNFTIIQKMTDEGEIYLLLQVDKQKLITEKLNKFKEYDTKINEINLSLDTQHPAIQIKNIIELKNLIVLAKKNLSLLLSISTDEESSKKGYYGKYTLFENRANEIFQNIRVILKTKNNDIQFGSEVMQDSLAKLGLEVITDSEMKSNDNTVIINVSGDLSYKKSYGNFNHRMNIKFKIVDSQQTYLNTSRLIEGTGTYDYKSSFEELKLNLEKKIAEVGILKFIGF